MDETIEIIAKTACVIMCIAMFVLVLSLFCLAIKGVLSEFFPIKTKKIKAKDLTDDNVTMSNVFGRNSFRPDKGD
jgi:hypothetical protein